MVRDYCLGKPVQPINLIHEGTSHSGSGKGVTQRNEVGKLQKFVNDNQDGIVRTGLRQTFDEVQ